MEVLSFLINPERPRDEATCSIGKTRLNSKIEIDGVVINSLERSNWAVKITKISVRPNLFFPKESGSLTLDEFRHKSAAGAITIGF